MSEPKPEARARPAYVEFHRTKLVTVAPPAVPLVVTLVGLDDLGEPVLRAAAVVGVEVTVRDRYSRPPRGQGDDGVPEWSPSEKGLRREGYRYCGEVTDRDLLVIDHADGWTAPRRYGDMEREGEEMVLHPAGSPPHPGLLAAIVLRLRQELDRRRGPGGPCGHCTGEIEF